MIGFLNVFFRTHCPVWITDYLTLFEPGGGGGGDSDTFYVVFFVK